MVPELFQIIYHTLTLSQYFFCGRIIQKFQFFDSFLVCDIDFLNLLVQFSLDRSPFNNGLTNRRSLHRPFLIDGIHFILEYNIIQTRCELLNHSSVTSGTAIQNAPLYDIIKVCMNTFFFFPWRCYVWIFLFWFLFFLWIHFLILNINFEKK